MLRFFIFWLGISRVSFLFAFAHRGEKAEHSMTDHSVHYHSQSPSVSLWATGAIGGYRWGSQKELFDRRPGRHRSSTEPLRLSRGPLKMPSRKAEEVRFD